MPHLHSFPAALPQACGIAWGCCDQKLSGKPSGRVGVGSLFMSGFDNFWYFACIARKRCSKHSLTISKCSAPFSGWRAFLWQCGWNWMNFWGPFQPQLFYDYLKVKWHPLLFLFHLDFLWGLKVVGDVASLLEELSESFALPSICSVFAVELLGHDTLVKQSVLCCSDLMSLVTWTMDSTLGYVICGFVLHLVSLNLFLLANL